MAIWSKWVYMRRLLNSNRMEAAMDYGFSFVIAGRLRSARIA